MTETLQKAWSAILVGDYDSTHVAIVDDAVQALVGVDVEALREYVARTKGIPASTRLNPQMILARRVSAALWVEGADDDA